MSISKSFTQDDEDEGKESDSTFSSNSSLDDSEEGRENEGHLHDLLLAARTTVVAHGKTSKSLVHVVAPDDDRDTPLIKLVCSSRLNRISSIMTTTEQLTLGAHKPCTQCMKNWLDYTSFWD